MWYRNETWFDRNLKVTHTKSHKDKNEAISYLTVLTTRPHACRFLRNSRYSLSKTICESACSQHRAFRSPTSMSEWFGNMNANPCVRTSTSSGKLCALSCRSATYVYTTPNILRRSGPLEILKGLFLPPRPSLTKYTLPHETSLPVRNITRK